MNFKRNGYAKGYRREQNLRAALFWGGLEVLLLVVCRRVSNWPGL